MQGNASFIRRLILGGFVLFLAAALVLLCCTPQAQLHEWVTAAYGASGLDAPELLDWVNSHPKTWHVIFYTLLSALALSLWRKPVPVLAALFLLGAGIELAQAFVPTREPHVTDLLYNSAGLLSGALMARRRTLRRGEMCKPTRKEMI
ncbi:MAG: VanZ family protein [Deltaproteobacteria bacterium]|nr:MAG: VanZ family protein [Deltaproteobacteria bacterium]